MSFFNFVRTFKMFYVACPIVLDRLLTLTFISKILELSPIRLYNAPQDKNR
ncbi:hypothetical protein I899_gp045 [Pelagibacter phage HTVC008M]|uniref:hypothetical protein n=1 Tax=Pelagibacter phage HTVC008M TaxID=1283076 RepID=UPI0002B27C5B|nr:hypothetical protein I899_gp045 [Pelagibacter phage HTVC008M]AGE60379.1 hypothetical protein [Pelagibacter phage HTVC008M]